jgi:pimeloyl-ACP methyl ester carboxylesterase
MRTVTGDIEREVRLRDGRRVRFAEVGPEDGVPLVFFQGTPSSRLLHPDASVTRELGVRMVVIDRPGFGGSDPSPGRTLVQWAEDVVEVLGTLGVARFLAAGVSGGGPYVLAAAWRWPDRVLAASVCGGSGPLTLPGALRGIAPARRAGYLLARHAPWLFRATVRRMAAPTVPAEEFVHRYTAHNPPADQAILANPAFRRAYLANNAEALKQGADGFADEVILASRDWGFDLREIRVPIHFWHGEADNSTPLGMAEGMAAATPGSRLTRLPGQGHLFVYGPEWRAILTDLLAARRAA